MKQNIQNLRVREAKSGLIKIRKRRVIKRKRKVGSKTSSIMSTDLNLIARCFACSEVMGEANPPRAGEGSSSLNLKNPHPTQNNQSKGKERRKEGHAPGLPAGLR